MGQSLNLLDRILKCLATRPHTIAQLAYALGESPGQLEAALLQLQRGRYVAPASKAEEHCGPACGGCSMNSLCPSAEQPAPVVPAWRLTEKGLNSQ